MEIIKPGKDKKNKLETNEDVDRFLIAWRNSEFYDSVLNVVNNELNAEHLKEAMMKAHINDTPLSNDEIGELARIEFQANLRIQNIKDALE